MNVSIQYLAGFLDGEGSVMITKSGRPRADGVQTSFSVTLTLCNTFLPALWAIQRTYGGRIDSNGKPQIARCKPGYFLIWKGQAAMDLIEAMLPHLLIKQEQAEVALEFGRLQRLSYRQEKTDEQVRAATGLYNAIRELNTRGLPEMGA